jgi:hypothetical protein
VLGYSSPEGQKVKWADGCPKEHQAEARSNRLVVHRATWADLKNLVLHSSKKKKKRKKLWPPTTTREEFLIRREQKSGAGSLCL